MTTAFRAGFSSKKLAFTAFGFFVVPATVAYAGFFALFGDLFPAENMGDPSKHLNSQNVTLLASAAMARPGGVGGPDEVDPGLYGDAALYAEAGPGGAIADVEEGGEHGAIAIYVVREGDSIASIAKMYDVSVNTILWANDISKGSPIKVGQTLVILPVSGVRHAVVKGDTLVSIAKKYKGDIDEILQYNGLEAGAPLALGDVVIIPDGEVASAAPKKTVSATSKLRGSGGPSLSGYFAAPLASYRRTQGLHGYNGIDLASHVGAPVMAAAEGSVLVARQGGYNGGYGNFVVIAHPNGTQTLYAHLQSVSVVAGQSVAQGQVIGAEGNSGRSTGPHLHFEVRGAKNPF